MKIKSRALKSFIKEVIHSVMDEVESSNETSHVVEMYGESNGMVTIENLELSDGRTIDAEVQIEGEWDDGAFDYEYGSERGTHRYRPQFVLNDYWVVNVTDSETGQEIYQARRGVMRTDKTVQPFSKVDKAADDEIESYMESNREKIETYIDENPPEPYVPGED